MRKSELEELLAKYHERLLRRAAVFCGSMDDARELVQRVFLYATKNAQKVLQHPSPLRWLLVVMRNLYIDGLRRKMLELFPDGPPELESMQEDPHEQWMTKEELRKAIQTLRAELQEVVQLYLDEKNFREIGESLKISTTTAYKRFGEACYLLGAYLKKKTKES